MSDDTLVSAENNISFGQLIAHWAKNPQEIPDQYDQQALRQALIAASLKIPDRIEKVVVIQEQMDTLHIVVPPREMYQKGEAAAASLGGATYDLHPEYMKQATGAPDHLPAPEFFYFRVGEYTINQCK